MASQKMFSILLIVSIIPLLIIGCTSNADVLSNTKWALDKIDNLSAISYPPHELTITLSFKNDGTVSGFCGCNEFKGNYIVDADQIELVNLSMTKMGCDSILMDFEKIYFTSLESVTGYVLTGHQLILKTSNPSVTLNFNSITQP